MIDTDADARRGFVRERHAALLHDALPSPSRRTVTLPLGRARARRLLLWPRLRRHARPARDLP